MTNERNNVVQGRWASWSGELVEDHRAGVEQIAAKVDRLMDLAARHRSALRFMELIGHPILGDGQCPCTFCRLHRGESIPLGAGIVMPQPPYDILLPDSHEDDDEEERSNGAND